MGCVEATKGEGSWRGISGAINLPLEFVDEAENVLPEKETEVIVSCMNTDCAASGEEVHELTQMGYTNVRHYAEGRQDWIRAGLLHVATIGPLGEPQSNAVWPGWGGEHAKFSRTKMCQKYRNVNRDPRIALSIGDTENLLGYLEIRGVVERADEDLDLGVVDEYQNHRPGDERVVVFVLPQHTTQKDG